MIITLNERIEKNHKATVQDALHKLGYEVTEVVTHSGHYLVAISRESSCRDADIRSIAALPGVRDVHKVSDNFKLVSRKWKAQPTTIELRNGERIGQDQLTFMCGPCSLEGDEQICFALDHLCKNRIGIMRGGAFKPRTSPYSFRGIGLDGLKRASELAHLRGVAMVSEVLESSQIEAMYEYVDIFQVGARNSQNFSLLHELGKVDKPVLLKRGISGTIDELLQSAEYVFASGNERIILCERGIRTYEQAYRNTLDLNAVPVLKEKTHLPVIVDPSHGVGIRRFVAPMACAAIMAGADGLLLEVHHQPERAASDGAQTLSFEEAELLYRQAQRLYALREESQQNMSAELDFRARADFQNGAEFQNGANFQVGGKLHKGN